MTALDATASRVRSADGTAIACERAGDGPAVIIVEAAGCYRDFGSQRPLAERLASDFTVFTYDRRGRGKSTDTLPYAIEREIEDLAALIAEAGGSAFVYGVSSGGLLALRAAASGLAIPRLALFEPPIGDEEGDAGFTAELAKLVAAGRRGEAVERFLTAIGVPQDIIDGMAPARPALEAVAHTLVYDSMITDATSLEDAAAVRIPTLVVDSEASTDDLSGWAAETAAALPNGEHRSLAGSWHGVPDEDLAPVLRAFFGSPGPE